SPAARVVKRDGNHAPFDPDKIHTAIRQAGAATGEFGNEAAATLTREVIARLAETGDGDAEIGVETIQDAVERELAGTGHFTTARAYIAYREQHARLRRDRHTLVDVERTINEYLGREDWRINANANQGYSLGGLILNVSGKVVANYWLSHVYPAEIGEAHRRGDIHIHDL
ncbi:anaerobic ribonucleoside-triphosphate reductase, partial [Arhodomonas sp. KWT]